MLRWEISIQNHLAALLSLRKIPNLQEKMNELINFIVSAPNLFLTGVGKNKDLADKISKTFNSVSLRSYFLDPVNAVHGDLGLLRDGDHILATSKSGTTAELVNFFHAVKETRPQCQIFLLHCNPEYPWFAHGANNHFYLPLEKEADHLNLIPTVSLVLMEVILHSAACQIIENRKFSPADLYLNHPQGAIGEKCQINR